MSTHRVDVEIAGADDNDLTEQSVDDGLFDHSDDESEGEGVGESRMPASQRRVSSTPLRTAMLIVAALLLLVAAAWLGRMSADHSISLFNHAVAKLQDPPAPAPASAKHALTNPVSALSSLLANNPSPPTPLHPSHNSSSSAADSGATSCPEHRPAAFMSLFHNTLLPDLSLSNSPYPITTTRLPSGELPSLSVYYCMNAEWFQYILDDTFPALLKSYTRVSQWDPNMPNLWSLQAFAADSHPVPQSMNRVIGQRRIFLTGEPRDSKDIHDMDAVFDTKTSPFHQVTRSECSLFPECLRGSL